ncbi:MAG: hypothetical protein RLZZ427_1783 [Pseudomonadota bacterium]
MARRLAATLAGMAALAITPAHGAAGDVCAPFSAIGSHDVRIERLTPVGPDHPLMLTALGDAPITQRFCRIEGRIETEIGFELWLPERSAWNERLLVGGVGGQAGTVNYRELARAVARGYAGASTDSGHRADDRLWLLGRADRAANYAGRANHLLALRSKAMLNAAYGTLPRHAFFVGCSGGGRQALTEVQRYPTDFDGVIAGAPGVNTPEMSARRLWEMQRHSAWGAMMPAAAWSLAYRGAIAQCDGLDGKQDGVVADPRQCHFDPASLGCQPGATNACLTPPQIAAVRTLMAPLSDETGKQLDDGLLPTVPVSPAPLPEPFTPGPSYLATVLFAQGVHGDANWDGRQFRLDHDLPAIDRVMNLHADNPAIEPFIAHGGKLILYQGWDDPLVSAQSTLAYHAALAARFGGRLNDAVRLFMLPGVEHCRGGPGEDLFGGAGGDAPVADPQHDLLSALEDWILSGRAPASITASKLRGGAVVSTRLICAWPARAVEFPTAGGTGPVRFECLEG